VFFIEVGLLLIVLPWSTFWEANYFAAIWPDLLPVMTNDFVRGGVSGIGLINLGSGVAEIVGIFIMRGSPPELTGEASQGPSGILQNRSETGIDS
jgi:hypothetical protein